MRDQSEVIACAWYQCILINVILCYHRAVASFFLSGFFLSCQDFSCIYLLYLIVLVLFSFYWSYLLVWISFSFYWLYLSIRLRDCFVKELFSQPNMPYLSIKNCHVSNISSPQSFSSPQTGLLYFLFLLFSSVI